MTRKQICPAADTAITMFARMTRVEPHQSLEGYFEGLLRGAMESEHLVLSEASSAYLVQLVSEYARRDSLHGCERSGETGTPALVWLFDRASRSTPAERFNSFRQLGDVALVVSGFFAGHIEHSLVDVNYYVQMGGTAYSQACALSRGGIFEEILGQLARSFRRVVEVMTRVAEQTTLPVARDNGAIYERWERVPESQELHQRLMACGLIPARRLAFG
jgi:hypothetical protein